MIDSAQDALEELDLNVADLNVAERQPVYTSEEGQILNALSREPVSFDKLVELVDFEADIVGSTLTMMEINGRVKNLGNSHYVLMN